MTNKEFLELYGSNEIDKDLLDMYIKIEEKSRETPRLVYSDIYGVVEKNSIVYEEAVYTITDDFICWLEDYDHIITHNDLIISIPQEYIDSYIELSNYGEHD